MKHTYAVTVLRSRAKFFVREMVSLRPAVILARVAALPAYNATEAIVVTCRTRGEANDWALRVAAAVGRAECQLHSERHTADLVQVRRLPSPTACGRYASVCGN